MRPYPMRLLHTLWHYRQFIGTSVRNEFVGRLARSRLGVSWMIIQPLVQSLVVAMVLSHLLAGKLPGVDSPYAYALYLLSGTLAWNLFQDLLMRCLTLFIDHANLLKKLAFPRVCLPMVALGTAAVNHVLLAFTTMGVFALLGHYPSGAWLFLVFLVPLVMALATGLGLTLGILNVFIRDIGQATPIVMQFLFWISPVIWMASSLPPALGQVLEWNPLFGLIGAFHEVLLFGRLPTLESLIPAIVLAAASLICALFLFRKASADLSDVV
ncbi:MAG: ABC transporter permease [Betaproteobacteria bacterium]|nr:ABC transporter permease [Betaproteobacteria bacterium]